MFIRLMLVAQGVFEAKGFIARGDQTGRESTRRFGSPIISSIIGSLGFCASIASP